LDEEAPCQRTRDEARKIANRIADQAHAGAIPFVALVDQYSEHADRAYQGDLGVWSTLAPGDHSREIETLSRLGIGDVSTPIDSPWGFQVIERLAPVPRDGYAMAAVRLNFDPDRDPTDPRSRRSVYSEARSLAQRLRDVPSEFPAAQERYRSRGVEQWEFGHGIPQIALALERLQVGEVGAEPVALPFVFFIVMRLDPTFVAGEKPGPSYDLPLRAKPDVERLFHDAETPRLLPRIDEFMRPEILAHLGITDAEQAALRSALQGLREDLSSSATPEARSQSYRVAMKKLSEKLSDASYSRVVGAVDELAARVLLANQ
jgi:hypothetical protein